MSAARELQFPRHACDHPDSIACTPMIAGFAAHPRWRSALTAHLVRQTEANVIVPVDERCALRFAVTTQAHGRTLSLPAHDHLSLNGVDVDGAAPLDRIGTALDDWLGQRAPALALYASRLPNDSPLVQAAREGLRREGAASRWHCRKVAATAWFDLAADCVPVPGKLRRNIARHERSLATRGTIAATLVDSSDRAALQRAFEEFLTLEASGWKGSAGRGTAIAADPALVGFYRALLDDDSAPAGPMPLLPVIAVLRLDGRAIATQFGLRLGDTLSLLKIAYDESEGEVSPGSQLLLRVMTLAENAGVQRLSLVTSPAWAERWKPSIAPVWHVTRYAPGSAARLLQHVDGAGLRIRAAIKAGRQARAGRQTNGTS